ncbi:MAG TPA: glycosyl transferase [Eubacteriaceae bacterium]|jgi:UDP-GlcNAc:undecaprenyl-phosphate GlcNAc-1-phosphate transferase|nr:glycosyl transferase [Eubacteriaceae bacterium]
MYFYVLTILISFVLTFLFKNLIYNMIIETKFLKQNYKGQSIPIGMGIIFPVVLISSLAFLHLFYPTTSISLLFSFGVSTMALLGIIDDLLGNRNTTGLKGHIGQLFKFKLTTGGLKALMGGVVSIFVSLSFSNNFPMLILNGLIIALFTNLINLLDLRPGRALKFFLFYATIIFIFFICENSYLLIIITIIVLVYFPMDIKAVAMMGDVGSNSLGFVLGFFTAFHFGYIYKLTILIFLVFIHLFSERFSITNFIENNKFLKYLDNLGR